MISTLDCCCAINFSLKAFPSPPNSTPLPHVLGGSAGGGGRGSEPGAEQEERARSGGGGAQTGRGAGRRPAPPQRAAR